MYTPRHAPEEADPIWAELAAPGLGSAKMLHTLGILELAMPFLAEQLKLTELEKQTLSFRPNYVSSLQGLNQHYLLLGNQTDDLHVKGSKYGFYQLTQVPGTALIPSQIGTRLRI